MNNEDQNLNIVCVGEAMVELSLGTGTEVSLGFAGDTLNTAIYLRRLLDDSAQVSYCTKLGSDLMSGKLLEFIQSESIDTKSITRSDKLTVGLYAISTDDTGERTFTYWRDNSAARGLFQNDEKLSFDVLDHYNVVYLSAITLAILPQQVRLTLLDYLQARRQSKKLTVAFDSNYRPALWESQATAREVITKAWQTTDIALPSIDDEMHLFADQDEAAVLSRLSDCGVRKGALKRGASGPLGLAKNSSTEFQIDQSDKGISVVDTTAAGDSFNAGYLSAVLTNHKEAEALQCGHDCAARVISHKGAIVPKAQW